MEKGTECKQVKKSAGLTIFKSAIAVIIVSILAFYAFQYHKKTVFNEKLTQEKWIWRK